MLTRDLTRREAENIRLAQSLDALEATIQGIRAGLSKDLRIGTDIAQALSLATNHVVMILAKLEAYQFAENDVAELQGRIDSAIGAFAGALSPCVKRGTQSQVMSTDAANRILKLLRGEEE